MEMSAGGGRHKMKSKGTKYNKLDETVELGLDYADDHYRGSPSGKSWCCLIWLDYICSGCLKLLLYLYRRATKRDPGFLEDNGHEIIKEDCQRLLNKNKELTTLTENLKNEVDIQKRYIHQLEETKTLNLEKIRQREKKIVALEQEKKTLEDEKQSALTRLSEQMAVQLRDNNPNIVDLSDQCRPTKLAEMFTELYDNEWTDAFSFLEETIEEEQSIVVLRDIFMEAYRFCEEIVAVPWTVLNKWFLDMNIPGAKQVSKWLKDSRKTNIRNRIPEVEKDFTNDLISRCNDSKIAALVARTELTKYMTKCVELSLLMVTTDPPVVVRCQVSSARTNENGTEGKTGQGIQGNLDVTTPNVIFNKDLFKEYTTRGYYLDYIVWPALFLHKDGPLLSKGIAQGTEDMRQVQRLWTWKK